MAEDPVASSSGPVVVSVCWVSASSRWAGSTWGWPEAAASRAAAEKASCALVVSCRSMELLSGWCGWSLPGATPAKVESIPLNSEVDRAVRPRAQSGARGAGTSYGVGMQPLPPVLEAVLGDITTQRVDAIVNAANSGLLGGGGVDGAIHRAAGPALLAECREVRRTAYPHGLPVGAAVTTGAGRLPARWVIHTVGPNRHAGETDPDLLAACYVACLAQAAAVGARSLAFPAVSAGAYGWSPGDVAEVAVSAVRTSPHLEQLELVRFVLFGRTTLDAFAAALA